jgi:hypothetical protein
MKQFILMIFFACFAFAFQSCNDDSGKSSDKLSADKVPAAVTSAFNAKYPGATSVEWETAKENDKPTYKAEFKTGNKEMKAEFAEDGSFVKEKED